jgi:hypothetical protein
VFSDDLRADSASTRVRSLDRVLFEDAKLVVDLNAKQLVKKVCGNVMAMLNTIFTNVLLWSAILDQHELTGSCIGAWADQCGL